MAHFSIYQSVIALQGDVQYTIAEFCLISHLFHAYCEF